MPFKSKDVHGDPLFSFMSTDHRRVTSYPIPHAASGSDKGLGSHPCRSTTLEPVAQAPTTDKGDINMIY